MRAGWIRSLGGLTLVVVLSAAPAVSEDDADQAPTPEQAGELAAAAHGAGQLEALRAIGARHRPDPWLTARHLLSEGRYDVALALTDVVPEGRRGGLRKEIEAWRREPESAAAAATLERTVARLRDGVSEEARAGLEALDARRLSSKALANFLVARSFENAHDAEHAQAAYEAALRHASDVDWPYLTSEAALGAGTMAHHQHGWEESVRHLEAAVASMRRSHPRRAVQGALYDLARSQYEGEQYAAAESNAALARTLAHELKLAQEEAQSLNLLGLIAQIVGRYPEAYELHRQALAMRKASGDARHQVMELTNAGRNLLLMGRVNEAETQAEEALALAGTLESTELRGDVLRLLAEIHIYRGEGAGALRRYREALALARSAEDNRRIAWTLHGMGSAYLLIEDNTAATTSLKEAVELKLELRRSADAALSLGLLAEAYRRAGDEVGALQAIDLAVDFHRSTGSGHGLSQALLFRAFIQLHRNQRGPAEKDLLEALELKRAARDWLGEANAIAMLAQLELARGKPKRAQAKLLEARAIFEKVGSRPGLARVDQGRARLHRERGEHAAALEVVGGALDLLRVMQQGLRDEDLIRTRQSYLSLTESGLASAVALDDAAAVFRMLEAGRAGALLEALGGRGVLGADAFPEGTIEAERRARAAEHRAQQELILALGSGDEARAQAAREALEESRGDVQRLIEHVERMAPGTADVVYPKPVALAAFQAQLGEHDAYVAYHLTTDRTYALVATRHAAAIHKLLPPPMLRGVHERVKFDAPPLLNKPGIELLRGLLVNPLKLPAHTRRILISPSGLVGTVPFGVLLPEHEVVYVPSATTLALLKQDCNRCQEGVLAVGAPRYPAGAKILHTKLRPLPHTAAEARAIGDTVLLGDAATAAGLREALKRRAAWSALHLACHAVMDPERPRRSALALTPEPPETGRLSVADVFRMHIPADLVTLSACETGVGKVERAEGIIGFTRAFMFAGAPRVLVSLWMVDDEATSALMQKFYEVWSSKRDGAVVSTARALREAQAWMRGQEKWSHPYYWGAWSLWGVPD